MNLREKLRLQLDLKNPSMRHTGSTAGWKPAKIILRLALPIVFAGTLVCTLTKSSVLAKAGFQADAKDNPAIDPETMDALNKMGVYLRTLKSFQVKADITSDDVTDDGQAIQSSKKVDMVAVRPNRLRVEITSDDEHRFFFFDGKNFTIFGQLVNYYATVPAPPTLAGLVTDLSDKYGIELPLADLFEWGTNDAVTKRIKGAMDVGPATVEGVTCEQYAFHQEQIDWQIWIQLGEFPLPRKLVIRTLSDDARPQHSEILTWNMAPSFSEDAFTFDPSPDARRITIAEVKGASNEKTK
jgi:hypothetical protein